MNRGFRIVVSSLIQFGFDLCRRIGKMIIDCMEEEARKNDRTRIVSPFALVRTPLKGKLNDGFQILDTQTGSGAEIFYERMGYQKVKGSDSIQRLLMLNLCVCEGWCSS